MVGFKINYKVQLSSITVIGFPKLNTPSMVPMLYIVFVMC